MRRLIFAAIALLFAAVPRPADAQVPYGLPSIGTSGATIPLLNGANTWSATQTVAPPTCGTGCSAPLVAGIEAALSVSGSGAPTSRIAFAAVNQGTGQASGADAAFQITTSGASSSSGGAFVNGLLIGADGLDSAGSLIRADFTGSLGNLIYIPNVTISGELIKTPTVDWQGGGYLTLPNMKLSGGTPAGCTGSTTMCLGGTVDATPADCGSFAGAVGCWQVYWNGANHLIPMF